MAAAAVAGTLVLVVIGVRGFVRYVDIADATPATAETSFEEAREHFAGTEPLVHLASENGAVRGTVRRRARPSLVRPDALRLMIWD